MTEEEKQAAAETAQAEADAKAKAEKEEADGENPTDANPTRGGEEEDPKNPDNKGIDYEAELVKEREAREKAEKALAARSFNDRKAKREEGGEPTEDDDSKPLTKAELRELLAEERQQTQKVVQESKIQGIAKSLSTSDAEANLIVEIHKNRTFPSHLSLEDQLEECYVIANRKKIVGERNEALRALKGKDGVNKNGAGTHRDPLPGTVPKMAGIDAQVLKNEGWTFNNVARRYEKKLSNGKVLFKDPQSGQVRLLNS